MTVSPFLAALGSEGPPPARAKDMDLYGWLIGSWDMETIHRLDDGTIEKATGEIHFGWVLEGRAIQDLWIRPRRPAPSIMYGTTLRVFDAAIDGWRIIWSDPLNQDYSCQIGRAEGRDIVQIGDDSRGLKTRWRFTEITADSFHWIGEERVSESEPWQITYEHFARRTGPDTRNTLSAKSEAESAVPAGPTFTQPVPIFRIFDEEKAREFYEGFLDCTVDWEHRFHPGAPLYAQVSRGGLKLHLSEHSGDASPGATAVCYMKGVEAFQTGLIAKNYKYNRPGLERQDWGLECQVVDPFGNRIRFMEQEG